MKFLTLFIVATVCLINACQSIKTDSNEQTKQITIQQKLADLETQFGGRLGVSALNTLDNTHVLFRAQERFPLGSTSKVIAISAVLKKSMKDTDLLQTRISFKQKDLDLSGYAPITKKNLGTGMTVSELCEAAMEYSDNTAMNLLMKILGGPEVVTSFARSIGDNEFRLERWEPELNSAIPGDLRDTSTPEAMEKSLYNITLGDVLAQSQREQFKTWLKNNTTGDARIRAGVPKDWIVGDKTGTGEFGVTNDVGIIWPPSCSPIVVAIYFAQNTKDAPRKDEIIAKTTHLLIEEFAQKDHCIKIKTLQ